MADANISRKLLKIFEGLVDSCCQHYQMLCKDDQLKAMEIMKNSFLSLELKQEGGIKEEGEYFEHDTTMDRSENLDDLKVKDELGLANIAEDQQEAPESDAETFQELNITDLDISEGSGEDKLMENRNNLKRTFDDSEENLGCKRLKAKGDNPLGGEIISHNVKHQDSLSSYLQTIVKTIVKSTMEEKALNRSKSEEPEGVSRSAQALIMRRRNSWSGNQNQNQMGSSSYEETSMHPFKPSLAGGLSLLGRTNSSEPPWYKDISCDKLTLTTRGPSVSAEHFGSCIGRFVPMESTPNCFVQKHSKSGRKLIMMRTPLTSFQGWLWTVRFEKDYVPVFQNLTESESVPTKGWQWWDLKLSAWKYDMSLTMAAFSPCGIITIMVRGAATEILPEKSVFKPKQGEWFSGRQV